MLLQRPSPQRDFSPRPFASSSPSASLVTLDAESGFISRGSSFLAASRGPSAPRSRGRRMLVFFGAVLVIGLLQVFIYLSIYTPNIFSAGSSAALNQCA